ncbi:hypothetical protein PHJA_000058200 [Phtheirospermum japonicum]|uniref:Uncharacterized protein n=1 Tax=Phtheirospermum japonicum TaxID=374723 RepID=A0A830AXP4_9LAMI|nr:hypothetical protein PHJA_000058200 [Phtheirospermum japonicum]
MNLISRTITLTPYPNVIPFIPVLVSPKPTTPRTRILCKNDANSNKNDMMSDPQTKANKQPTRNPRRKPSYGASRRSVIKKSFTQEQVEFTAPVAREPAVGIIGGGMSGLVCALYLEKRGIKSTVFDTSEALDLSLTLYSNMEWICLVVLGIHGLGGRMGTRTIDPQPLTFDHAAQFFTVTDPDFAEMVDLWSKNGLVRQWHGSIGELKAGGCFDPLPPLPPRYVGVNGMRPLADSILSEANMVNVVRPCWVSKLEPYNGMWHLSENGKPCGQFDVIVIAHNGLPLIARQMKRLDLSSIWALMAAFEDPLPVPFEGSFVKGIDSLSWMSNNTTKLFGMQSSGPHCWTFFSTAAFGKNNKVPQVLRLLWDYQKTLFKGLSTLDYNYGIWGAALPTNSPGVPCIFDPHGRAGICGDWLLGSSLEAAALSGMALANHANEFAVGLRNEFQPLKGHDIGQFPGLESERERNKAHDLHVTA